MTHRIASITWAPAPNSEPEVATLEYIEGSSKWRSILDSGVFVHFSLVVKPFPIQHTVIHPTKRP